MGTRRSENVCVILCDSCKTINGLGPQISVFVLSFFETALISVSILPGYLVDAVFPERDEGSSW